MVIRESTEVERRMDELILLIEKSGPAICEILNRVEEFRVEDDMIGIVDATYRLKVAIALAQTQDTRRP